MPPPLPPLNPRRPAAHLSCTQTKHTRRACGLFPARAFSYHFPLSSHAHAQGGILKRVSGVSQPTTPRSAPGKLQASSSSSKKQRKQQQQLLLQQQAAQAGGSGSGGGRHSKPAVKLTPKSAPRARAALFF